MNATGLRDIYCGQVNASNIGQKVNLCGWVSKIRDHGEHLVFVDLRDHTGIVQCVVEAKLNLKPEYVLRVTGTVFNRPEDTFNDRIATGEVEIKNCEIQILNTAETLPIPIDPKINVEETQRLKYRFIDIRSDRMQYNLRLRHRILESIRHSMSAMGFLEVDTPLLWMPTPEGAREFLVPSRLQKGQFYSLPQSPQIAKQLLMVAGIDRYFQIAKCLRDEDLRSDRQFEFTQLDLEASFVKENDIMDFVSKVIKSLYEDVFNTSIDDIPKMTWIEAMYLYGTDKPDLRIPVVITDLSQLFENTNVNALKGQSIQGLILKGGSLISRAKLDELVEIAKRGGAKGLLWLRVTEDTSGIVFDSPVSKFFQDEDRESLKKGLDPEPGDLILIVSDEKPLACKVLNIVLSKVISDNLIDIKLDQADHRYVWITDFPMFESVDESNNAVAAHHPFTMPNIEDLDLITKDPLKVRSSAYDLVLNGWELGSGSVRIHDRSIQETVFKALGLTIQEAYERFGFMLEAFKYGAPPHAGFGLGIDRLVAILANESSIREVIAFPKSQSGIDLMTLSPSQVPATSLKELGIQLVKDSKNEGKNEVKQ
jgi:aspartyl-tRNA synthetase